MTRSKTVRWRKSSRSNDLGECIEVAAFGDGAFGVRDSKDPGGPTLVLDRDGFRSLLMRAKTAG